MDKKIKKQVKNRVFLSIIVPTYNEEKNILNTLKKIGSFLESQKYTYEILLMDDGSTDSTSEIASNFSKANKFVKVCKLPHRGKAATVIAGMEMAGGDYVLFSDADLATPIEEVKKLLHYVINDKYDIAIASREGIGAVRKNEPFIRHIMGRVFNLIVQILLVKGLKDTQCGFKLFTNHSCKKVVSKLSLYKNAKEIKVPKVTAFDVEILFVAKRLGFKIKSVPVEWTHIETDRINPLRDSFVNFFDVLKVWLNDKKGYYK